MDSIDPSFNVINVPGYGPMNYGDWLQMMGLGGEIPSSAPAPTPTPTPTATPFTPNQWSNFVPMPLSYPTPSATPEPSATPGAEPFIPVEPNELPGNEQPPVYADDGSGGPVTADELGNPPAQAFPPGAKIPGSAYPNAPVASTTGKVPGEQLSPTDRANIALRNLGLPPLPTGYSPFSGLPPGFTEGNRFGGGAPIFTPPNFTGPNWSPGGSIFGGTLSPTGWVAGGGNPGNLGGGGGGYGLPYQMAMFHGIWSGKRPMPYSTWLANAGFRNYQGDPFGGTYGNTGGGIGGNYQNYLSIWNNLRNAGTTGPGVLYAKGERSGAGVSGAGRPMTRSYQTGGVVGDDDFYAGIGEKVYKAGRKVESKAGDVFHALGELGKYLKGSGEMPIIQGTIPGIPKSPDAMIEWMMTPDRTPTPTPYPTPADGKGRVRRFFTDPDLSPRRMRDEMEPPPALLPEGPPPYPWIRRFMPQLYDQRAGGSMLAGLGGVYPPDFPPWAPGTGPWRLKQEPRGETYRPELFDERASGAMLARNTDTVPAMLTPGEVVLNKRQQQAVMPVPGRENMLLPQQRAKLAKRMWS